jgi:hypothetical protein
MTRQPIVCLSGKRNKVSDTKARNPAWLIIDIEIVLFVTSTEKKKDTINPPWVYEEAEKWEGKKGSTSIWLL